MEKKLKKELLYKVTLETVGLEYKAEGKSISEALEKLGLKWNQTKGKGVVKVRYGSKTLEHLFYLNQLKRIFANKLTRLMWGKRLELLLKD